MELPLVRILFLCNILLAILLACVSLGVHPVSSTSDKTVVAFSALALIFLLGSLIVVVILLFTLQDKYRLMMIINIALIAVALICFGISTGVARTPPLPQSWLLSGTWMTVMCLICAVITLFIDDD